MRGGVSLAGERSSSEAEDVSFSSHHLAQPGGVRGRGGEEGVRGRGHVDGRVRPQRLAAPRFSPPQPRAGGRQEEAEEPSDRHSQPAAPPFPSPHLVTCLPFSRPLILERTLSSPALLPSFLSSSHLITLALLPSLLSHSHSSSHILPSPPSGPHLRAHPHLSRPLLLPLHPSHNLPSPTSSSHPLVTCFIIESASLTASACGPNTLASLPS